MNKALFAKDVIPVTMIVTMIGAVGLASCGAARADMMGHGGVIRAIAVSPGGALVATAIFDHSVRIWRFDEQRVVRVLDGHDGPVNAVTFLTDGQRLASGGADGNVLIWNGTGTAPASKLQGHRGR